MGASRTSNKDIAGKLDTLIDLLTQQAIAAPVAVAAAPADTTNGGEIAVDDAYMACLTAKAAEHATNKGAEVVLYARKNKAGETKLAYALRDRYDDVVAKRPSCLGAVGSFQP